MLASMASRLAEWRRIAAATAGAVTDHHSLLLASGVAFTSALGLVPALVTVTAFYGLVASPSDVETHVSGLTEALPEPARELIVTELEALTTTDRTTITIGLVVGLAASIYAVSSVVNAIVMAIRVAHEQPSPHTWIQGRLFALRLSAVAIASTAIAIWLMVALPPLLDRADLAAEIDLLVAIARWPTVLTTSSYAIALLYRVVAHQRGHVLGVSAGALSATAIWVISTWALGFAYAHIGQLQNTFTTLGALAALLVWLYLSAVAVVIGAELDQAITRATGHESDEPCVGVWLEL